MPQWVEFGRWEEAHRALAERIADLERWVEQARGSDTTHGELARRITVLEDAGRDAAEHRKKHDDRVWLIIMAIIGGVVFPLVVTSVITLLHLSG